MLILTEGDLTTLNNLTEMGEGQRQGHPCRTRAARGAKQTCCSSGIGRRTRARQMWTRPRAMQLLQENDKQAEGVPDSDTPVLVYAGLL